MSRALGSHINAAWSSLQWICILQMRLGDRSSGQTTCKVHPRKSRDALMKWAAKYSSAFCIKCPLDWSCVLQ
ncbi:unnamed protein product [Toxocara canis]|uniref:Secreted protein n=1 Tax=Toxocara canis TaxID=6265 RepID=A0A183V655_TOXCA|nr:unnamed protein product [Toxocara canis]